MRIIRIDEHNMLNGDGLRTVIWTSGCSNRCPGCQNPETWNYEAGEPLNQEHINKIMKSLEPKYISGVTFSGGDPLYPQNIDGTIELCELIKSKFPHKTIWVYTGYTQEQILKFCPQLYNYADVVVEGPFVKELADINYHWAGSTNQIIRRLNDAKKMEK